MLFIILLISSITAPFIAVNGKPKTCAQKLEACKQELTTLRLQQFIVYEPEFEIKSTIHINKQRNAYIEVSEGARNILIPIKKFHELQEFIYNCMNLNCTVTAQQNIFCPFLGEVHNLRLCMTSNKILFGLLDNISLTNNELILVQSYE
jgi:hypothetical protein